MEAGGQNEKLELDFIGGDEQKTLAEALDGIILWHKAYIKLTRNTVVARLDSSFTTRRA
jgi:hypothetical protein